MVGIHDKDEVYDKVYNFLRQHFLHWLEALSLMNRIAEAIELISVLQLILSVSNLQSAYLEMRLALI